MAVKCRGHSGTRVTKLCLHSERFICYQAALAWGTARTIDINCEKTDKSLQVIVHDNNVDQAMRVLKKKMQREGVFREMKLRRFYEKPSERRAREQAAAVRRARKLERKRAERDNRT